QAPARDARVGAALGPRAGAGRDRRADGDAARQGPEWAQGERYITVPGMLFRYEVRHRLGHHHGRSSGEPYARAPDQVLRNHKSRQSFTFDKMCHFVERSLRERFRPINLTSRFLPRPCSRKSVVTRFSFGDFLPPFLAVPIVQSDHFAMNYPQPALLASECHCGLSSAVLT